MVAHRARHVDLGERPVTVGVGALTPAEVGQALAGGLAAAEMLRRRGLITWRYAAQDHVKMARPVTALLPDVVDQVANLGNRREVAVSGAGEQRDYAVPVRGPAHRLAVRPEPAHPD